MILRALTLVLMLVAVLGPSVAAAVSIPASASGTVRIIESIPLVLGPNPDYVEVFHQNDDNSKGIVEFNISSLTAPVSGAHIFLTRQDSGLFPTRTFSAVGYVGNGVLEVADFSAGTTPTSFLYSGEPTVSIDVTSFINSLVGSTTFAGFTIEKDSEPLFIGARFNQLSLDQPIVSLEVDPAGSVPETVPEPGTVVLLGSALVGMALTRLRLLTS